MGDRAEKISDNGGANEEQEEEEEEEAAEEEEEEEELWTRGRSLRRCAPDVLTAALRGPLESRGDIEMGSTEGNRANRQSSGSGQQAARKGECEGPNETSM